MMKRTALLALALFASACAAVAPAPRGQTWQMPLVPADAATTLAVGGPLIMRLTSVPGGDGQDPLNSLLLTHPDGRTLTFQEANHTANDLMVQRAGGALANVMGFYGAEVPRLFNAIAQSAPQAETRAAFLCGPGGPATLGFHETHDNKISVVALRTGFAVEDSPSGGVEVLPVSPDQICARLKFTRG